MGFVAIREILPIETISIGDLKNKTIAVDAYNILYQFLSSIRDSNGDLIKHDGKVVSHLYGFLYRYVPLIKNYNIHFIFVFDGKPSEMKTIELKRRREWKKKAEQDRKKAVAEKDIEKIKMFSKRIVYMTDEILDSFKELLLAYGCDVVQAESEGEATVVQLVKKGIADYALTQDYDALLYGCDKIIRNLSLKRHNVKLPIELISTTKLLKANNLTLNKLIYLASLVGTDYNNGVQDVGIKRGLKLVGNTVEETVNNLINAERINYDEKEKYETELTNIYNLINSKQEIPGIIKGVYSEKRLKEFGEKMKINIKTDY